MNAQVSVPSRGRSKSIRIAGPCSRSIGPTWIGASPMFVQLELLSPEWTSSAEASPVRTCLPQAKAPDSPERDPDSGTSSAASSKISRRRASSSRTSPPVRDVGCPTCGETCTCWGTEPAPSRSLLSTSERPTSAKECSCLLPTPTARGYGSNKGGANGRVGEERASLDTLARRGLLPTPRASESENRQLKRSPSQMAGTHGLSLAAEISETYARAGLLPTPTVKGNHDRKGLSPTSGDGLQTAAVGGPLSPRFVEWLMGFPDGWTEIEPSEIRSIQAARRSRAKSSRSG